MESIDNTSPNVSKLTYFLFWRMGWGPNRVPGRQLSRIQEPNDRDADKGEGGLFLQKPTKPSATSPLTQIAHTKGRETPLQDRNGNGK